MERVPYRFCRVGSFLLLAGLSPTTMLSVLTRVLTLALAPSRDHSLLLRLGFALGMSVTPRQSSTAELGVVVAPDFDERERERER
jgi:hypothetical protein